jgi:hypothetical protein
MNRKPRDPLIVAVALFSLLLLALFLYLASAAVDRQAARRLDAAPWVPPGWVSPTSPPPASSLR